MPYRDLTKRNMSSAQRREALGKAAPPVGYAPTNVTSGPDGKVIAVRSVPENDEKHVSPIILDDHDIKFVTTLLDSEGSIKLQYVRGEVPSVKRHNLLLDAVDRHFEKLEQRIVLPAPVPYDINLLPETANDLQVTALLGDPHIGMLSWHLETGTDFDLSIAQRQMAMAVDLLLARSPFAARFVLANLGDFFHAENDKQLTPSGGNKLDCDGRTGKILDVGFDCIERFILRALDKYPEVWVVNLPGNHDPKLALVLARWLKAQFRNEPRVHIVVNDNPYVFVSWGQNLHMYHHGDGAKPPQCKDVMAAYDGGRPWGQHEYRMIYGGHIHHLQRLEFPGCVYESSRTLAPGDYWHHHKGYRAGRGMRTVTHHKDYGHIREDLIGSKEVELALG